MTAAPLAQRAQELPKDLETEIGGLADQFLSLPADAVGFSAAAVG